MTLTYLELGFAGLTVTTFVCSITTGLILTFATAGGISAGDITFGIAISIALFSVVLYIFSRWATWIDI